MNKIKENRRKSFIKLYQSGICPVLLKRWHDFEVMSSSKIVTRYRTKFTMKNSINQLYGQKNHGEHDHFCAVMTKCQLFSSIEQNNVRNRHDKKK